MVKSDVNALFEGDVLVHTMVRGISRTGIPIGENQTVQEVDADVSEWVSRGYRLVSSHLAGFDENGFTMIYVLSK